MLDLHTTLWLGCLSAAVILLAIIISSMSGTIDHLRTVIKTRFIEEENSAEVDRGDHSDIVEYESVDIFEIDNEELSGVSPALAFVLGVEWALFRERLSSTHKTFVDSVHIENRERLEKLVNKHGRTCTFEWSSNDKSESWVYIRVSARE